MTSGVKPCAACGSAVADVALGRGAVELADGKRYCSPCAAKLKKGAAPGSVVIIPPSKPPAAKPPAPPAKDEPITVLPLSSAKPPSPAPAARKAASTRVVPPKKHSSAAKPGAKNPPAPAPANGGKATDSRRITRRSSARALRPWHQQIKRPHLIAIAVGGGVVLLIAAIIGIAASGSQQQVEQTAPRIYDDSEARRLIGEADRLVSAGKNEEALKKLRLAVEIASKNGRDDIAKDANVRIYSINKMTPVNIH